MQFLRRDEMPKSGAALLEGPLFPRLAAPLPASTVSMAEAEAAMEKGGEAEKEQSPPKTCIQTFGGIMHAMFLQKPIMSLMHVFFPPALYWQFTTAKTDDFNNGLLFLFSLLALVPQAERLGYITEQLALHVGQTMAGLINVCCGNVPELIVVIVALFHTNKPTVVQESLIGGVLSNLLLVLGLSLLAGGISTHVQKFNTTLSSTLLTALFLMALAITLITMLPEHLEQVRVDANGTIEEVIEVETPAQDISHIVAVFGLLFYGCFLVFSMKTHTDIMDEGGDDDEDDEEEVLGLKSSLVCLAVLMTSLSMVCDGLVDAIEGAARSSKISELFITAIILPNVNNAPEHLVAIRLGWNNKVNAVMAIAVGSSAQLALFLLPIGVLLDWFHDGTMDLNTKPIVALGMLLAVIFTALATQSGKSTWILGVALLVAYLAIALSWFFSPLTSQIFCPDPCIEYVRNVGGVLMPSNSSVLNWSPQTISRIGASAPIRGGAALVQPTM